ncbi:hypothetical protein THICB3510055 [Thiomonas sp. CB3]|nr:hypothetical protein THICB3510055 [Thiomonas sp. CB3]
MNKTDLSKLLGPTKLKKLTSRRNRAAGQINDILNAGEALILAHGDYLSLVHSNLADRSRDDAVDALIFCGEMAGALKKAVRAFAAAQKSEGGKND